MLFGGFFLVRLFGSAALAFFPGRDDDFEAVVFTRFERAVRLENIVERVSFRNKATRVDELLLDGGSGSSSPVASTPPVLKMRFLPYMLGSGSVWSFSCVAAGQGFPVGSLWASRSRFPSLPQG